MRSLMLLLCVLVACDSEQAATLGSACDDPTTLACPCEGPLDCAGERDCVNGLCLGRDDARCGREGGAACFEVPIQPVDSPVAESCPPRTPNALQPCARAPTPARSATCGDG